MLEWIESRTLVIGECRVWTGYRKCSPDRKATGYGLISFNGKRQRRVHRVAWELRHGPIPDGMGVLHSCDNPPCIRDEHLFIGTQAVNVREMLDKGRAGYGVALGQESTNAKLQENEVRNIRTAWASRSKSKRQLARAYGVCVETIRQIVRLKSWKHVM